MVAAQEETMQRPVRFILWLATAAAIAATPAMAPAVAQSGLAVDVWYLRQEVEPPPGLTELDPRPADAGIVGAVLARDENETTGRFLNHAYTLTERSIPPGGDFAAALDAALGESDLLLIDAPAATLLAAADRAAESGALLFNVGAPDPDLRDGDCRANVLHTLPSLAMRADALAQMLVWARWRDVALLTGPYPEDRAFAMAIEAAFAKFGLEIGSRADWTLAADLRRSAGTEVRTLTQGLGEYDVLVVADEVHDFGRLVLYNTWAPRPVVGSEGLVPSAWSPMNEQWGAIQLQNRFADLAGRAMTDTDYAAWAAMRSIGEAVTRTGTADPDTLRTYMLGDAFELAGFKGTPLSFRKWNGQMRQPIVLAHPRGLTAVAPLDGFLNQTHPLDTLGIDAPESRCEAFRQ
jgi:ABC transporter substrate binding protein (PQQ-dependent alcohol dehydrogenase system)